jgi:hypothetical protein
MSSQIGLHLSSESKQSEQQARPILPPRAQKSYWLGNVLSSPMLSDWSEHSFSAARRLPPYLYHGSRNGNRPAVYANREPSSRDRTAAPFRRDRAQPDIGIRGTRRSDEHGSRRTAERQSGGGFGFHLTASAVSSTTRRLVMLRLTERFALWLRSDHVANLSQHLNARRERVAIIIDDPAKLPFEGGGLLVSQVKVHTLDLGMGFDPRNPPMTILYLQSTDDDTIYGVKGGEYHTICGGRQICLYFCMGYVPHSRSTNH